MNPVYKVENIEPSQLYFKEEDYKCYLPYSSRMEHVNDNSNFLSDDSEIVKIERKQHLCHKKLENWKEGARKIA